MKRTCKQCGREFELTDSQIEWYEQKGLQLPKRCESCRAENKKKAVGGEASDRPYSQQDASGAGQTITTAVSVTTEKPRSSKGVSKKAVGSAIAVVLAAIIGIGGVSAGSSGTEPAGSSAGQSATTAQTFASEDDAPYTFRTKGLLNSHYEKHGKEMGYADAQAYVEGANKVVDNPASLHKRQKDRDFVYYLEETDELVVVSSDGYIRTYFNPGGIEYYYKQ